METVEFLSEVWAQFAQGQIGIEAVLNEYHKYGFDVNQDIPGNVYWEDLYLGRCQCKRKVLMRSNHDFKSRRKFPQETLV